MRIYNTKTRQKEEFVPITEGKVGIYVCGPTVYDYFHVGNARAFLISDVLRRFLMRKGYHVTYVQNFTDIDDRMIARAQRENTTVAALGQRLIQEYFIDAHALGIMDADVHPKATDHMQEIIGIIARLMEKGLAYEAGGDVYFSVQDYEDYGKLSGQVLEDLEAGARIEVDAQKKHPMDFALWKGKKENEPFWPSPWGEGRPGWHIECSAMSAKYLGDTFDIHCGGEDLIFPHHENECAQSQGVTGKPLANYWMHCRFINVNDMKMSKSKDNFFTVRDIGKEYDLEIVRLFLLSAHYRSPVNFSEELLQAQKISLERLYNAKESWQFVLGKAQAGTVTDAFIDICAASRKEFDAAMEDDLNTAGALGVLFTFLREANKAIVEGGGQESAKLALGVMQEFCDVLGLLKKEDEIPKEVRALLEKRQEARTNKDFVASDTLRAEIAAAGYLVEDTKQGQKIKPLR